MRNLYFVTSNQGKIDNLNNFVHEFSDKFNFVMLKLDFEELKNDTLGVGDSSEQRLEAFRYSMEETAINKAKTCLSLTDKDHVIVSDTGIFIDALNGFPGVNTGFAMRTIGNEGILRLMEGKDNKNAIFQVSMAYAKRGEEIKVFTAKSNIEIATKEKVNKGFDWDSIVLGNGEYFSDNTRNEKKIGPYRESIRKLLEYIKNDE